MAASNVTVELRLPWYVLPVVRTFALMHMLGLPTPPIEGIADWIKRQVRVRRA